MPESDEEYDGIGSDTDGHGTSADEGKTKKSGLTVPNAKPKACKSDFLRILAGSCNMESISRFNHPRRSSDLRGAFRHIIDHPYVQEIGYSISEQGRTVRFMYEERWRVLVAEFQVFK